MNNLSSSYCLKAAARQWQVEGTRQYVVIYRVRYNALHVIRQTLWGKLVSVQGQMGVVLCEKVHIYLLQKLRLSPLIELLFLIS